MKFSNLLEELKDIPTYNVVYHGTNLNNLIFILNSGLLKPNFYATSLTNKPEIAVGRKNFEIEDIPSLNIEGIYFVLYKDRILGSKEHRGIRLKTIAEFPTDNLDSLKSIKKRNEFIRNNYKNLLQDFEKINAKGLGFNQYKNYIEKKYNIKTIEDEDDFRLLFNIFNEMPKQLMKREMEERFYFNKNKKEDRRLTSYELIKKINYGIKLSPDFMKINLDIEKIKSFLKKSYNFKIFIALLYVLEKGIDIESFWDMPIINLKKSFSKLIDKAIYLLKKYEDLFDKKQLQDLITVIKNKTIKEAETLK